MLELSSITLIAVATKNVEITVNALIDSYIGVSYGSVKLVSHYKPENLPEFIIWEQINPFLTIDDWNKYIFYYLYLHIQTKYCLLIHADGFVINPGNWKEEFLQYDYIGAPWPIVNNESPYIDIYGNTIRVGNSVSIRSKKLLELPVKLGLNWIKHNNTYNEDVQICVYYRHIFEQNNINYAPLHIAKYFSKENNIPEQIDLTTFAFHKYQTLRFTPANTYIAYTNLDSRPDRDEHMKKELSRINIIAERRSGILPDETGQPEDKIWTMKNRTPGAIGCHYSQVAIMEEALKQGKHALVMEDDLVFCDDIQERLEYIGKFLTNNDWDIMWLGGTYHKEPTWHKIMDGVHSHPDLKICTCTLNKDWEPTEDPRIVRTYGCWSTYAYIVNKDRLPHILESLDQNVYRSMGIDWLFILLQPHLNTFAFNPGCVKQYDNKSNIGQGDTIFSVFSSLGEHWYKQNLK